MRNFASLLRALVNALNFLMVYCLSDSLDDSLQSGNRKRVPGNESIPAEKPQMSLNGARLSWCLLWHSERVNLRPEFPGHTSSWGSRKASILPLRMEGRSVCMQVGKHAIT